MKVFSYISRSKVKVKLSDLEKAALVEDRVLASLSQSRVAAAQKMGAI